jgi:sugar phosphate permease
VGLAAPAERQAGAQGLLGGLQTLVGGLAASVAGWNYDTFGRATAFISAGIVMIVLVTVGFALAGEHRVRRSADDPASAVPA